jgi:hypothetical protein
VQEEALKWGRECRPEPLLVFPGPAGASSVDEDDVEAARPRWESFSSADPATDDQNANRASLGQHWGNICAQKTPEDRLTREKTDEEKCICISQIAAD